MGYVNQRSGGRVPLDPRSKGVSGDGTDLAGNFTAGAEQEQGGNPLDPKRCETPGETSTLTSTTLRAPARSAAACSTSGPIVRHGPHHGAQRSTSTSTDAFETAAKLPSRCINDPGKRLSTSTASRCAAGGHGQAVARPAGPVGDHRPATHDRPASTICCGADARLIGRLPTTDSRPSAQRWWRSPLEHPH